MPEMLKDGSNPEWVDPEPPLDWKGKEDLVSVKVYGAPVSMPANKICVLLVYYKVPFKRIGGQKKKTPYPKVPVMDVGARQVNDSGIILKNLAPALGIQIDEEWSSKISLVWDATFRYNITKADAGKLAGKMVLPCACMGCCIGGIVANKLKSAAAQNTKANPDYQSHPSGSLTEPCKEFKAEFKGQYHGGDSPDSVDFMVYGFMLSFVYSQCTLGTSAISDAGLGEWWSKMEAMIPTKDVLYGTSK